MIEIGWFFTLIGFVGMTVGTYFCFDGGTEAYQIATIFIITGAMFLIVGSLCLIKHFTNNYRNAKKKHMCPNCNNVIEDDIIFCPCCGNKLK